MNDRIKLLQQAARHFACTTEIPGSDKWFEKCDTKFAELIIQACERVITKDFLEYSFTNSTRDYIAGYGAGSMSAALTIKENFRVK